MKTNKMRIVSFILTFVLLINVLGIVPFTVGATEIEHSHESALEDREYLTLPEFEFPSETYLDFSDFDIPTDEIQALFPETIEIKYENGIYYVEDIGAESVYLISTYDYHTNTNATYDNGYWMFEVSEEQATETIHAYFSGVDGWDITYYDGERSSYIEIESDDGDQMLSLQFEVDGSIYCNISYVLPGNVLVNSHYFNGEAYDHSLTTWLNGENFQMNYNIDGSAKYFEYYCTESGYLYLLEQGWSSSYAEYVPCDPPEGREDWTLDRLVDIIPHDIEGNYVVPVIESMSVVVDGVEYQEGIVPIYRDSIVEVKVYGNNLHRASHRYGVQLSYIAFDMDYATTWYINESADIATKLIDPSYYSYFYEWSTVEYFEDGNSTDTNLFLSFLNCREHDRSGEQTCNGYYCSYCEEYFGESNDNHNLDTKQTCLGYWCKDCLTWQGEAANEHTGLSDKPSCCGYYCSDCNTFIGDEIGDHVDENNDTKINVCDYCEEYIGSESIILGENIVSGVESSWVYMSFVATESEVYTIYSTGDNDPAIEIYDENMTTLKSNDDISDTEYNFLVNCYFEEGKTYYLAFYAFGHDFDINITVARHTHEGTETDCRGTYCIHCEYYFGDPDTSIHHDGNDSNINLCDYCNTYLLDSDIDIGVTEISANSHSLIFYRIIPEESGTYTIYSTSNSDPLLYLYNDVLLEMEYSDDVNDYDFYMTCELEAGKTYYLCFYDYDAPASYTVTIEFHKHEFDLFTCLGYVCGCGYVDEEPNDNHKLIGEITCIGYECEYCGEFFGEVDPDAHIWYYGYCSYHVDVEFPEDVACEHSWYEGDCIICGEEHDCASEDFDEYGFCVICNEDAGFIVTTNGVSRYYKGFTAALAAAVDGSVLTLLENRITSSVYDIHKDIVFDANGFRFRTRDGGALNVYANVIFVGSSFGVFDCTINVYEKCNFINGEYSEINLYNGLKYSDVIYACSYANMYDYIKDTFINLNSIQMDAKDDIGAFVLYNDDPHHVWKVDVESATCTENTVETTYCIYCAEVTEINELEDSATGHRFAGNYNEGTKSCVNCGLTEYSKIYSGDIGKELGAQIVNYAYDFLKNLISEFIGDKLEFLYE